ncbi:septum site-determining protein Ssd [Corynebacterium guangdongense]|uniref:Secretion/DNA translocation related CpaE-like protein n=1 Tax=Corynebacterium guangdongense TaxID=1783348 RepID=A0ABU2A0V8_9CORY|nr:septum site-determining protein Ssd [Corynebacterium guangdongense]MDR7330818.1 secretion/DNA translocation related CpaE-like protein [Corynebacterium guangdongense]WJZ16833.1 hypothetical protein CGUA_01160 [Corynebacterium guangdongense]
MSRTTPPLSEPYLLTAVANPLLHPDVGHAAAATGRPVIDLAAQLDGADRGAKANLLARHLPRAAAVIVDGDTARVLAGPRTHDHIFVTVRDEDPIPWEDVLACHADQVFYLPAQAAELLAAIADLPRTGSPADGTRDATHARGRVLIVTATAGGAGTSTLAAAVARTATRAGQLTTLVDGVDTSGGMDLLLGLEDTPGARWPDLHINPEGNLDAEALRTALPAEGTGLAVLSAARPTVAESFQLRPETIATVASTLAEAGGTVIVDAPPAQTWVHGDVESHPLATAADHLVLLTTAQVRPAAAASSIARRLAAAGIPHCLVARHRDWSGLDATDLTRLTGLDVSAEIATLPRLARTTEIAGLPNPVPAALGTAAGVALAAAGLPGGPR